MRREAQKRELLEKAFIQKKAIEALEQTRAVVECRNALQRMIEEDSDSFVSGKGKNVETRTGVLFEGVGRAYFKNMSSIMLADAKVLCAHLSKEQMAALLSEMKISQKLHDVLSSIAPGVVAKVAKTEDSTKVFAVEGMRTDKEKAIQRVAINKAIADNVLEVNKRIKEYYTLLKSPVPEGVLLTTEIVESDED